MPSQPTTTSASALVPSSNDRPTVPLRDSTAVHRLPSWMLVLRHGLREQAMQVAAVHDVIFGAVALFEIDERQAVVDLARIPIAPGQSDRLGRDGMQLVGESDGVKELHGVGADVDTGAEFGELGAPARRPAPRNPAGAARWLPPSPPRPAPTMAMRRALAISCSVTRTIAAMA